jgi:predicted tellurium resistance membrane protein TerC
MDFSPFLTAQGLLSLVTLSAMEIVLGIDNIVFLSILTGRLPAEQQPKARRLGLLLALGTRIGLLFAISWVMSLTKPWFEVFGHPVSGRDLILLGGGGFLIAKATKEIHEKLEVQSDEQHGAASGRAAFGMVLVQVAILDVVFSLDSVITAVGMAGELSIMVVAMLVAVVVMLLFAGAVGDFVHRHPTMKVLALSFLILIGVMLVAEGTGQHISKGYIYFAMAFSFVVELLNLRVRKPTAPVELNDGVPETHNETPPLSKVGLPEREPHPR